MKVFKLAFLFVFSFFLFGIQSAYCQILVTNNAPYNTAEYLVDQKWRLYVPRHIRKRETNFVLTEHNATMLVTEGTRLHSIDCMSSVWALHDHAHRQHRLPVTVE